MTIASSPEDCPRGSGDRAPSGKVSKAAGNGPGSSPPGPAAGRSLPGHGPVTMRLTMVAVPGSFHFIMLDLPDRFRAALEAFLAAPR